MNLTVLIVDDEKNARRNIQEFLTKKGFDAIEAETLKGAYDELNQGNADIVLLDDVLPDGKGTSLLAETAHIPYRPPIIIITAHGDIGLAVNAMKNGAYDFLEKPIQLEHLEQLIEKAGEKVALYRELELMRKQQQLESKFIVGTSAAMQETVALAERAALASANILITGETGTGKEVLARYIYSIGARSDKAFVPIDSGAMPPAVLESELFGHEPGAFTSAEKRKVGLMQIADEGILFLDEISSMPLEIQAKLLRAIEEQTFRRMGGTKEIKVDVQILAASNRNLEELIAEGAFREDLFYRLKVFELEVPPLRERRQDIPELAGFFIKENNPRMGLNIQDVSPQAMEILVAAEWKGNIRLLKHVIERAMILCDGPTIDLPHLPADLAVPA